MSMAATKRWEGTRVGKQNHTQRRVNVSMKQSYTKAMLKRRSSSVASSWHPRILPVCSADSYLEGEDGNPLATQSQCVVPLSPMQHLPGRRNYRQKA